MTSASTTLPDDPQILKEIIAELIVHHEKQIAILIEEIRLLRAQKFGRKSEKIVDSSDIEQLLLFDEVPTPAELAEEQAEEQEEETAVPAHTRKKPGRKPLPEDLPRVEVVHDLPAEAKICGCGYEKSRIGEEVSEQLDVIPAKMQVIRHIRPKYACRRCEGVEDSGPTVVIAPPPAQMIPKSMATAGLLAHVLTAKFVDALPFYRQEKIFSRHGVEIRRATMCCWAMRVAQKCEPLLALFREEILAGPLIQADETTVQVLIEPGRAPTTTSYMWIFRGGDPNRPTFEYQYHPTRSGDVAAAYLRGYRGYVQTDGYGGYDFLDHWQAVVHVGCWAHARRKFTDVIKTLGPSKSRKKTGLADQALGYIGKLYAIDKEAKAEGLDALALHQRRQAKAVPVLEEFYAWLQGRAHEAPPKSLIGKAISYTLNQWERLKRYVDDGRVAPDNNLAENAIRPFVIGRKNWLFSGVAEGAKASATLYSIIETAKANGLDPYWYLRALFDRLPLAETRDQLYALLPQHIDRKLIGSALRQGDE
jgi:transposase